MLAGPLVTRELVTDPRKFKHFGIRAGYVAALSILMYTGAQATFALAPPRGLGDIARFGVFIFGLLSFVQLAVVIGTSLLFTENHLILVENHCLSIERIENLCLNERVIQLEVQEVVLGIQSPRIIFLFQLDQH